MRNKDVLVLGTFYEHCKIHATENDNNEAYTSIINIL